MLRYHHSSTGGSKWRSPSLSFLWYSIDASKQRNAKFQCINYQMFNKCCGNCDWAANCCSCCTCGYDNGRPSRRSRNKHHQQQPAQGNSGEEENESKKRYTSSTNNNQQPPPYSANTITSTTSHAGNGNVQTTPPLPAQPMMVIDQPSTREAP